MQIKTTMRYHLMLVRMAAIKKSAAAAIAKLLQLCVTLYVPIDSSPPGSPVPGIFQARILEWVAISFSNAWKWKVKVKLLSHVWLLATPWTTAYQVPPYMGFSRQEYWSGVPLPSPIKKSTNNKFYKEWRKGTLLHCWWECKLIQPLWRTVGNRTPIWPSNPTARQTHWGNQNWKRHMYPSVHRSNVYNSQDMEPT